MDGLEVTVLKTSSVYTGEFDSAECKVVVQEDLARVACPVLADRLIVSRMNTPNLVGAAGFSALDLPSVYLPDRLWQVEFAGISTRFVHRWTQSLEYRAQVALVSAGTSASMHNLGQEEFKSFVIPVPPASDQAIIVAYLDREIGQIDALIAKQDQLVGALTERRQSAITQAVTRGLNSAVELQDSGVYWLHAIPEHWVVRKFNRVASINGGQVDPRVEPFSSMTLIAPNHVEKITGRLLAVETAADQGADSGKYLARSGQVIYSKIRPALRKAVVAPFDCLCSADMYAISGKRGLLHNRFLHLLLLSEPFSAFVTDASARVAMPKVNRDALAGSVLWFPPLKEQEEIITFIDEVSFRIDTLIAKGREVVEVLKERRQALISAAVTGKIDVRGL